MVGIQCSHDHIFSMTINSKEKRAEWKLEECYYMSQGCEVVKGDYLSFSPHDKDCPHCSILEHEFENLIEEIKGNE